jgi:hypothetical protein
MEQERDPLHTWTSPGSQHEGKYGQQQRTARLGD